MIKLVLQFIDWIKNLIDLVLGIPSHIASLVSEFTSFLGFFPGSLGSVIMGFISFLAVFILVLFIVKLVVSLL
jgi:hypothetical protein